MTSQEGKPSFISPSEVFPLDGEQVVKCPNCDSYTRIGYTVLELNIATENNQGLPVICAKCKTEFYLQNQPSK